MKFLFLLFPVLEIAGFVLVATLIGVLPMLALVVAGSLSGFLMLRKQGLMSMEQRYRQGHHSADHLKDMMSAPALFIAGILLLIPGFFTDILALILLIPKVRLAFFAWMARRFMATAAGATASYTSSTTYSETPSETSQAEHHVIEGEFSREEPKDKDSKDL